MILDSIRTSLHRAITSPLGDRFAPLGIPMGLARRLNVTLGQPLCSKAELAARREAAAKLARLRAARQSAREAKGTTVLTASPPDTAGARVAAPVMVYFEKGRNPRELAKIEDLLKARSIAYQLLDVGGDEATLQFVTRTAGCKDDDLPVVFVASTPVGAYPALVDADVSGELAKKIYG